MTEHELAELLIRRGMPGTVLTPMGVLPYVVVVLSDPEDPRQETLLHAFGGVHLGGPDDRPAAAISVAVHRGAIMAARVAATAIDREQGLHDEAAAAWRDFLAICDHVIAHPADPQGRRPKAVYQQIQSLSGRIARTLGRLSPLYDVLHGMLPELLEDAIANGVLGWDLGAPTKEDLEQPLHRLTDEDRIIPLTGERRPIRPMPVEELRAALDAWALIQQMDAAERERRVRRLAGDAAFDPAYLFAGVPHDDRLFMHWCGDRWASEDGHTAGAYTARAYEALRFVRVIGERPELAALRTIYQETPDRVLEALAEVPMTSGLEAPAADGELPEAHFEIDFHALLQRLGLSPAPNADVPSPRRRNSRGP